MTSESHVLEDFCSVGRRQIPAVDWAGREPEGRCDVFGIATSRVVNGARQSMGGCREDTVLAPSDHQWKEEAQVARGADLTCCCLSVHPSVSLCSDSCTRSGRPDAGAHSVQPTGLAVLNATSCWNDSLKQAQVTCRSRLLPDYNANSVPGHGPWYSAWSLAADRFSFESLYGQQLYLLDVIDTASGANLAYYTVGTGAISWG
jgi:hypothetical protein